MFQSCCRSSAGLLAIVNVLFGFVLKSHKDLDDERWKLVNDEILRIRNRIHNDIIPAISRAQLWRDKHDHHEE